MNSLLCSSWYISIEVTVKWSAVVSRDTTIAHSISIEQQEISIDNPIRELSPQSDILPGLHDGTFCSFDVVQQAATGESINVIN